jgi:DNA-binding transcriptional LysR family regulator
MDLDAVEVFVKVVQARSFTRAARELSMPNTTVSSKIARLERRLGTTLLQRTTRKLHITPAGQAYFEHCVQGLDHIRAGEAELESKAREPGGMLRITASSDIAHTLLPPIIAALLNRYPKVGVELVVRKIARMFQGRMIRQIVLRGPKPGSGTYKRLSDKTGIFERPRPGSHNCEREQAHTGAARLALGRRSLLACVSGAAICCAEGSRFP